MTPLDTSAAILVELLRGPGYGLEIIERVRARTAGRVVIRQGALYPALRSVIRRGYGRSWKIATPGSGRPRTYYELTPAGIDAACDLRDTLREFVADGPRSTMTGEEIAAMRRGLFECAEASDAGIWLRRRGPAPGR